MPCCASCGAWSIWGYWSRARGRRPPRGGAWDGGGADRLAGRGALFSLTPLGEGLRGDIPGSQRAWAIWEGDLSYRAWGALDHSVASGETAFEHVFGRPFFDYLGEHPQAGEQFNRAMTDFTLAIGAAVAGEYDFAPFRTVVDLGGGRGHLLAAILSRHPALHGTLFDLPHLVPTAQAYLNGAGLRDRVSVVGGDFFVSVPPAGLYVLSHIVHDWDDARSVRLLRVCREAVQPQGRLLIVEKYIPEPMVQGAVPPGTDVNMLVLTGGRERTEGEYRALLGAAGWRLERVLPTSSISSIFEALPRKSEVLGPLRGPSDVRSRCSAEARLRTWDLGLGTSDLSFTPWPAAGPDRSPPGAAAARRWPRP